MSGYHCKAKITHPLATLLFLFTLFASLFLTPSEYPDCQSLDPDENLDCAKGGSYVEIPAENNFCW